MTPTLLLPWQAKWRAIADKLTVEGLKALQEALQADSEALIQGCIVWPHIGSQPAVPIGACAVAYCIWKGTNENLNNFDINDRYMQVTDIIPGVQGPSDFTMWYDKQPRDMMRAHLLTEVFVAIAKKERASDSADSNPSTVKVQEPGVEATPA